MEKEIFNIINTYQSLGKGIDFDYIMEIIILASKYYDINNYIKNTEIRNDIHRPQAQYNVTTKEIYVNLDFIDKVLLSLNEEFESLKQNKSFLYLYTAKILLHEIEHAYQHKKIEEQNGVESEILRAEYKPAYDIMKNNILLKIPKMLYHTNLRNKYYVFSPSERLAEHSACECIEKVAITMQDEESYDIIQHFKYGNILRGYNIGLRNDLSCAPTKTYLEKINSGYDYTIIEGLSSSMNQYNKIRFGLEADKEELNKIAMEWQLVYKKVRNNRI